MIRRTERESVIDNVLKALANNISTPEQLPKYSVESTDITANVAEPTVPTSLSGGEYFSLAGGTDDSTHHKQGFLHSGMGSRLIILDPELCLTTPAYHCVSLSRRRPHTFAHSNQHIT